MSSHTLMTISRRRDDKVCHGVGDGDGDGDEGGGGGGEGYGDGELQYETKDAYNVFLCCYCLP